MRRRGLAGLVLLAAWPALAEAPAMVPLMGKRLFGPEQEELGRLVDLVVDAEGRPIAAVVDVGGFMGLGSRRVALAWSLLRFETTPHGVRISIGIPAEQVTAAEEYRPGDFTSVLVPPAGR